MTFELEKFVDAPTQEELKILKKDDLLSIAKHYKLEDIKRSMRKAAICNNLLRYFVEQEIFDEGEVEYLEETEVGSKASEQLAMRRMEMKERQKDREIEERQKNREFELELKKMEAEERQKSTELEERQKNRQLELEVEERRIGRMEE